MLTDLCDTVYFVTKITDAISSNTELTPIIYPRVLHYTDAFRYFHIIYV